MLSQLRKHLILLSTCLTSLILSIAVVAACLINCSERIGQKKSQYNDLLDTIIKKFSSENIISYDWMTNFEVHNNIILHIEENGVPFSYRGSWYPNVSRDTLFLHTQNLAIEDGYVTGTSPKYNKLEIRSQVYEYSYRNHDDRCTYYHSYFIGTPTLSNVVHIPTKKGYLSLTIVQILPELKTSLIYTVITFCCLDLIGILALLFTSRTLIDKALKPVYENNRKQTEFIAAASHDLRTPLAIIQCNASALLLPDAKAESIVPKIIESCTSMSRLITDLLSLATSDSKTWKLTIEDINTEAFLIELFDFYSEYCQSKEHNLTLELPDDVLPEISADKGRLNQVLGILLDNALSYSPKDTDITIKPYLFKNHLVIEIMDHGIGVADSEKKEIFTRFYRIDKSRGDHKHFGLGLNIAKELIELQSGKLYVKDTLGGGATFVIEVPAKINA